MKAVQIYREVVGRKGLGYALRYVAAKAGRFVFYDAWLLMSKPKTFEFNGKTYRYFNTFYGPSWQSERCVEVALGLEAIKGHKDILEIGNVLSHYLADMPGQNRIVVDKYEKSPGVINEDVISFNLGKKFDMIVSISTLEHVGYDEQESAEKIFPAIENLRTHLKEGGKMFVTLPVGQNPPLDSFILEGRLKFKNMYFMKRISRPGVWVKTTKEDAMQHKYNEPYPHANALVVLEE